MPPWGSSFAWRLFGVELLALRRAARPDAVRAISARVPFLYRASLNKWWFDDLYDLLFMRIGGQVANFLWWFDRVVIDGTVNGIGALTADAGRGCGGSRPATSRTTPWASPSA